MGAPVIIADPPRAARQGRTMIRGPWTYGELDWDCPHCGFPVHLLLLDSANGDGTNWSTNAAGIEIGDEHSDPGQHVVYLVCRCPRASCKGFVFAVADAETRRVKEVHPYTRPTADSLDRHIPFFILDDISQATHPFIA